jgi:putative SOS response-associated peptidase YedK
VTLGSWGLGNGSRSRCGPGREDLMTGIPFEVGQVMPVWLRELQPCAIPADGFIGTGHVPPRMSWRVARPDGRIFWMAGFWRAGVGELDSSFALLTAPQSVSGIGIIERAPVLLVGASAPGWLNSQETGWAALKPMPPKFLCGTPMTGLADFVREWDPTNMFGAR